MNKSPKKLNCKISKSKGFTLVELLVATVILSVGILAVSQMTIMGLRVNTVVNQRMYARVVMAQLFEELANLPANDPLLDDWDHDPSDLDDISTPDHSQTIADSTARYSYAARWNVADNTPEPNIKTIRIHILWGVNNQSKISTDLMKQVP